VADKLTVAELENRWDYALRMTRLAVSRQPAVYRELKSLAARIAAHSLDIREYLPTVNKLISLLEKLDPGDHGSIFSFFNDRIHPSSVWSTCWLRMECKDLLAHLDAFEKWRLSTHRLKVLK
jgi:hypothetical protein